MSVIVSSAIKSRIGNGKWKSSIASSLFNETCLCRYECNGYYVIEKLLRSLLFANIIISTVDCVIPGLSFFFFIDYRAVELGLLSILVCLGFIKYRSRTRLLLLPTSIYILKQKLPIKQLSKDLTVRNCPQDQIQTCYKGRIALDIGYV